MANNVHPEEDVFNILIASDIHLGYGEDDPIIGNDSFNSFEEILQIGRDNDVDLILLGGDLFHITNPTQATLHKCMSLLREYCLGDRPVSFEILSDQEQNFANTTQNVVNYEDPNINVSIPVFSIHGNHDDATGENHLSALDILSCSGLVNYFGKILDLDSVPVDPILLRKGETLLALYGLSHIPDKRLCRLFELKEVSFHQPSEYKDDWFNLLVLHQNRMPRGVKSHIEESVLPSMLDLVVWGHEHDCRIEPEKNQIRNFDVMQPGSSVATSLSYGESIQKHVAIVKIHKRDYHYKAIPLKTVRTFIFEDVCTTDPYMEEDYMDMRSRSEQVEAKAEQRVNEMIEEANVKMQGNPQSPGLPLIRLRLFYSDESEMVNQVRFGQKFENRIANPGSLLLQKKRTVEKKEKRDVLEKDALDRIMQNEEMWDVKIEDYIKKYFDAQAENDDDKFRLNVLTVTGLNEAVSATVGKSCPKAFEEIVKHQSSRMEKYLMGRDIDEDNIDDEIAAFYVQRCKAADAERDETRTQLAKAEHSAGKAKTTTNGSSHANDPFEDNDIQDDEDEDLADPEEDVGKGRGRGRGRAARGGTRAARTPRTGRGARAASKAATSASTGSTRGRGRAAQQTLQQSFSNASQISVVRTSARSSANRSRIQYQDDDDDD